MEANYTQNTKSESTPGHLHNTKFSMEPMSNLANIKPKLGCRLGEFGTPDSIHGARKTLWLDQLGSTQPLVLMVRHRLSPNLARSALRGRGSPANWPPTHWMSRGDPGVSATW